ncbi:MAG: ABC transporter permease [Nanohaloarchaea archaeon]|nr:ABC transporter permease [Candidatus Nanohaloarchaea archaeon]
MRKVKQLLKAYLLDTIRNPVNMLYGVLMVFGVLGLTAFVLNQGTTAEIVASYSVFIVSYAAISAIAYSIAGDKEKGLYRMYRGSRLSKTEYVSAKVLIASLPVVFSFMVIGVGTLATSLNLGIEILPILVLSVLAHAGIGLLIGSFVTEHADVQKFLTIFLLGMTFLAPVFYTSNSLPEILVLVQQFIPLTHGVEAMRAVMVDGAGIEAVWTALLLLSILSAAGFILGYRRLEF